MKFKDRIKQYSFWTALSGAIIILLQTVGKQFGISIDNQVINDLIMGICGVLVVLGIVIKPATSETGKDNVIDKNDSNKL